VDIINISSNVTCSRHAHLALTNNQSLAQTNSAQKVVA